MPDLQPLHPQTSLVTALLIILNGTVAASPIVDTAQSTCYNSTGDVISCPMAGQAWYGQDAQQPGQAPRYGAIVEGTVTDQVTGLVWQHSPDLNQDGTINAQDKRTLTQALSYCEALNLGGFTDWRLPDITQLYSLIEFSGTDPSGYSGTSTSGLKPFLDTSRFAFGYGDTAAGERIIDAQYASSTRYVATTAGDGGNTLFGVNFADGRIKGYGLQNPSGQEKTFYVRCVRGATDYGHNQFLDHGDGTISDQASGLMWARDDSGAGLDWAAALDWVAHQNAAQYLGHDDWRLPNAKELQSLVDYSRSPATTQSAAIDPRFNTSAIVNEAGQPDFPAYWTSTTHANTMQVPGAYAVYLAFGRAMGYMNNTWVDVHGAGAQRSDPKQGHPDAYPTGHGPQGDAIRIENHARLVRNDSSPASATRFNVNVTTNGSGTLSSDPAGLQCSSTCSASFVNGASVTLKATPASGYTFSGWSGDCTGSATTCILSMTTHRNVSATFTNAQTLVVTRQGLGRVSSVPTGIDCGSDCQESVASNVTLALTARPDPGFIFKGWTGACTGSANPCSLRMTGNSSVTAQFVRSR